MSNTIVCVTVLKDGSRGSKRTVARITIIDHDVVSSDTGVCTIVMGCIPQCVQMYRSQVCGRTVDSVQVPRTCVLATDVH